MHLLGLCSDYRQNIKEKFKFTYILCGCYAKSLQSCSTLRPQRRQPTRLPRPWDSPGKNTGVGCHFLLQCMKVKSLSRARLSDPMDCSLPGSSTHGIFQARVLEWVAIAFSNSGVGGLNSEKARWEQETKPRPWLT